MKLNFVKVNPVENMTIFIRDQIPRKEHKDISNKVMDYNNLHAEQVGFIEKSSEGNSLRLQMMGGEFCGNATRSLAALMVYQDYPDIEKKDGKYLVQLETSGKKEAITCEVEKIDENKFFSKIEMSPPESIEEGDINFEGENIEFIKVNFEGITHFIVDNKKISDQEKFYNLIKKSLEKIEYEAFGIMYYDFEEEFLEPIVYVKSTDSLFWERSCGSGSCALGVALSYKGKKEIRKDIKQPGGSLNVSVEYKNGEISKIYLNGEVEIVAEGVLYI